MFAYEVLFYTNACMLVGSFYLAVQGAYEWSVLMGILSVVYAIYTHSPNVLGKKKVAIVEEICVLYVLIHTTNLHEYLLNVDFLMVCSSLFANVWASSSMKVIRPTFTKMRLLFVVMLVVVWLFPSDYWVYMNETYGVTISSFVVMLVVMFVPYLKQCALKALKPVKKSAYVTSKWYDTPSEIVMR